jgi:16S rRNA (guanine966-N2)-methyltransferase
MSIKILGGLARGRALDVPTGNAIRPTSVMLRRRLFDARQDLSGWRFCDLCAGSGSVGIEAWSRGVEELHLNEKNRHVFQITLKNISMLKKFYSHEIQQRKVSSSNFDCLKFLNQFKINYQNRPLLDKERTILFFDPPYEDHDLYLNILDQFNLFQQSWFVGELWIESDETKGIKMNELEKLNLPIMKKYVQGTSFVAIIKESN